MYRYYRISIVGMGRDGFETDRYGLGWAWKLRVLGTDLEVMGMGRDRVQHLSSCSSLVHRTLHSKDVADFWSWR